MTTQKSAIVIGGGISGLAAGCYLQKNGYTTAVYEMAPTPGGVTASWERKGYTFDGGTNWFPGSGPRLNFFPILNELLDFKNHPVIDFDTFMQVRLKDGSSLNVFTDPEKLKHEMLRIAPEDKAVITTFIRAIRFAARQNLPVNKPRALFSLLDYVKMACTSIPLGLFYAHWRKITIAQFAQRFSNPRLRLLFERIFPRHTYFSVLGLIVAIAWMSINAAGYPMGGSSWVISSLTGRFKEYGGTLKCSARVTEILVKGTTTYGVRLQNGDEKHADIVVAACDVFSVCSRLLGGKYTPPRKDAFFRNSPVYPALIQVSLGINRDLSGFVHKTVLEFAPAISCGRDTIDVLQIRFCHFDPGMAPSGRTAVIVHLRTHDYQFWVDLRNSDITSYNEEKKRISGQVIDILEDYCGPLRTAIEVVDTATPATYIRYTDTYKGSYQSWAPVPELIGRSLEKKLPGVANLYLCGQWTEPAGGLPRAIISARNIVQIICHENGARFRA